MKRSTAKATLSLATMMTFALVICVACQQRSADFSDVPDENKKKTTKKTNLPEYPPNSIQASVPKQLPTCFPLANRALAVYRNCYSTLLDSDETSDSCDAAVGNLANTLCNGLQARINNAKSTCSGALNQYRSRLPAACQQAVAAL